jgi:hypothetical protein
MYETFVDMQKNIYELFLRRYLEGEGAKST